MGPGLGRPQETRSKVYQWPAVVLGSAGRSARAKGGLSVRCVHVCALGKGGGAGGVTKTDFVSKCVLRSSPELRAVPGP